MLKSTLPLPVVTLTLRHALGPQAPVVRTKYVVLTTGDAIVRLALVPMTDEPQESANHSYVPLPPDALSMI